MASLTVLRRFLATRERQPIYNQPSRHGASTKDGLGYFALHLEARIGITQVDETFDRANKSLWDFPSCGMDLQP